MAQFERIVRPYQSPAPLRTDLAVAQQTLLPAQRARLRWGGQAGTLPPAGSSFSSQTCHRSKETERKSHQVKVVNPDDDTQYVIVESVSSIWFRDEDTSGQGLAQETTNWADFTFPTFGRDSGLAPYLALNAPQNNNCKNEYDLKDPYATG